MTMMRNDLSLQIKRFIIFLSLCVYHPGIRWLGMHACSTDTFSYAKSMYFCCFLDCSQNFHQLEWDESALLFPDSPIGERQRRLHRRNSLNGLLGEDALDLRFRFSFVVVLLYRAAFDVEAYSFFFIPLSHTFSTRLSFP